MSTDTSPAIVPNFDNPVGAGRKIARQNGLAGGAEMFAWILDGAGRDATSATLGQLPPPLRVLYRAVWKPRFEKTQRW